MFGQGILRVEGKQVVIAAALDVEIAAEAGEEVIGVEEFGGRVAGTG